MKTITLRSTSPVGALVDAFVQGSSLSERSEAERAPVERDLRDMQSLYDGAAAAVTAAVNSRELTALGVKELVRRTVRSAADALKTHEAKVKSTAGAAAEVRKRAIAPPTSERDMETLLFEREVRDRLAGKDPLEIGVTYLSAVQRGDTLTMSAIERAPASFALLKPEQLQLGQAMRLTRSPLAPAVVAADATAFVYQSTLAAVRTELGKLAEQYDVGDDEGK